MRDELNFNQAIRQWRERVKQHHQPVRWIKYLALGIADDWEPREYVWVPQRNTKMPQFFVNECKIRIKKVRRVPGEAPTVGEQNLPIENHCEEQEKNRHMPIAGFLGS